MVCKTSLYLSTIAWSFTSMVAQSSNKGFSQADDEENPHEAYGYTGALGAGTDKESHMKRGLRFVLMALWKLLFSRFASYGMCVSFSTAKIASSSGSPTRRFDANNCCF